MLVKERKIWTPDNSHLLRYRADAEAGKIIIGQELWQELDNLYEDFHNERYYYDTEDARIRMAFMEGCIRLTKSPFYNKPMRLMDWQRAWIEALYSFHMTETQRRRFKKTILLISRKNGKTEQVAALCNTEFIVGKEGADIVCSSNDDAQASLVYDAIDLMRQLYDPKDTDTKRNQRYILNKSTNTKVFKLSDKTRNKEGRNIDIGVVDEVHEMKDNVIAKSIEQSQSLKEEPLMILITTEGFVIDGYLDAELQKARKIINKEDDGLAAERILPWLYTQDSEQEVWIGNRQNKLWMKSNPTLGTVKKWEYLEEQVDLAKQSKADRFFVLAKDFNIKQAGGQSWLNIDEYNYPATYDLEDFRGSICLGGVDLAETTDLACAKILMMKPNDPTKYIHTQYFIPESKLTESPDIEAGAKYEEWRDAGLLTVCEGNDVDLAQVADWFYQLYEDYDIRLWKCGYDQRFSKDWIKQMEFYGWMKGEDLVLIPQNKHTLSNAIKLVEADLKHQAINFRENPVDRWCFANAALEVDSIGQCLIVKKEKKKRIDGAVTTAIVYETYRQFRTEYKQMITRD